MNVRDVIRKGFFLYYRMKYRIMLGHKNIIWGKNVRLYKGITIKVGKNGTLCLGDNIRISSGTYILAEGSMRIGENTLIGNNCILACLDSIDIAKDCLIAHMVSIRDHEHNMNDLDRRMNQQGFKEAPVQIGENAWLGDKVTVTSGVTIGKNSVIGANAVVTKSIPENVIAAGVPAKIIRRRIP